MRTLAAALISLLLGLLPALAAPPKAKPKANFSSPEEILKWINDYRQKPEAMRLPAAVKAMSDFAVFRELETSGVYIGFMAGVIGSNPAKAEQLVTKMFPMPPEHQVAIIRAIAYSGLPDWKELLTKFIERMPARKVLIERYLTGKAPTLKDIGLDSGPATLDALWGYYYATGSVEPVQRIVSALAWAKEQNSIDKLTIGSMAKWTLASNLARDSDLLMLVKRELPQQPKEVATQLRDVIEAAETFETARIRKEAVAALEELKAKGPAKNRNASWWAQAGTTAIALGCVAAGALGQIQFGIPCLVGGPLSSVAAKYAVPQ